MDFFEALRRIANGEHITKQEWGDNEYWGQLLDGKLVLRKPDGICYPWIISDGDLNGNDWMTFSYA